MKKIYLRLPDGRLITDWQIMTGQGLSELDLAYIDAVGQLPRVEVEVADDDL